ncbi:hypothetical protein KAI87_09285, partial [Myxococcota bacterium]|nr:hypothetical protein [Myxococcota bacterium]
VDDTLPGMLREMAGDDVKRAADVDISDYDLVVVVDVAEARRTGDAAALLKQAPQLLVIDHHHVELNREAFDLPVSTPLHGWIDPDAEAAAMMVAGTVAKLEERHGGIFGSHSITDDAKISTDYATPLAAGMLTDTGFFAHNGVGIDSLRIFKSMVPSATGGFKGVEHALSYKLATPARDYVNTFFAAPDRTPLASPNGVPLSAALEPVSFAANTKKDAIMVRKVGVGNSGVVIITVPKSATDKALRLAQEDTPTTNAYDVRGHILDQFDEVAGKATLAVLLFEEEDGTRISTRGKSGDGALQLAKSLGGGGHARAGGARLNTDINQAAASLAVEVNQWLQKAARPAHLMGSF